jgi:insertion element IS1 protein InsB
MVYVKVLCPDCGSDDIVLNGRSNRKQRFLCRNEKCSRKTFQLEYTYNVYTPGVKQQVVEMAQNGSGTRDTGRVLGISKDTVTAVLKKHKNSPNKSMKTTSKNLILVNKLT